LRSRRQLSEPAIVPATKLQKLVIADQLDIAVSLSQPSQAGKQQSLQGMQTRMINKISAAHKRLPGGKWQLQGQPD
jgi:hypothetical protein